MSRDRLPQLDGEVLLTDGGLETTLIFKHGIDLPLFAAFTLLGDEEGERRLRAYYEPYLDVARQHGKGFVLDTPTWRASPRWSRELGYTDAELDALNRRAVALLDELRAENDDISPVVIAGVIGPQDDGYEPTRLLSADAAQEYHSTQIGTFADTAADMVSAMTLTYPEEAIGVTRAAAQAGIPAVISFTLETDGRLPNGQSLGAAIEQTDAETDSGPAYFMVNCAHPTHFQSVLQGDASWQDRILGVRPNASTMSHAELDQATELDDGDPVDLGRRVAELGHWLPRLAVLGGCCGTDARHVAAIADGWRAPAAAS